MLTWFVAPSLLGGDYGVEGYSEFGCGGGEQVVVHVGDYRELIACFQFAQSFDGVSKRLPVGQRFRQGTNFSIGWREAETLTKAAHYGLQDISIAEEISFFCRGFE